MAPLLHRAAIKKEEERNYRMKILWSALLHRAIIISFPLLDLEMNGTRNGVNFAHLT